MDDPWWADELTVHFKQRFNSKKYFLFDLVLRQRWRHQWRWIQRCSECRWSQRCHGNCHVYWEAWILRGFGSLWILVCQNESIFVLNSFLTSKFLLSRLMNTPGLIGESDSGSAILRHSLEQVFEVLRLENFKNGKKIIKILDGCVSNFRHMGCFYFWYFHHSDSDSRILLWSNHFRKTLKLVGSRFLKWGTLRWIGIFWKTCCRRNWWENRDTAMVEVHFMTVK